MFIVKMKRTGALPSVMDSSLDELTVTLEVLPDELNNLFNQLTTQQKCSALPMAATARHLWSDSTELWTASNSPIFFLSENSGVIQLKQHHSVLGLSCATTGMDVFLIDNTWSEI
mmetsp:Transcript_2700/g.4224  ORF Transcript_2700/g.4224 Transcript_2700/m.4224 type:complete len:115 (+) Transcript_2700:2651-2995(+)